MPTPAETHSSPWLTPVESGDRVKVSVRTIYRLVEKGVLPAHRVGSRIMRIHRDDLDAAFGRMSA